MAEFDQRERIIQNLEALNRRLAWQNSFWGILLMGILYGIGFFIGSAIIATIALGILGPWIGEIPWIQHSFQTGASLLHK